KVAYFSSQGPTHDDGRVKPDIVAPGYHLFSASAKPDQASSCAIGPMAGTSMATPVVAGVAAMIRQYFVQGWYPSGIPTPSNMFNPSNALVKAMVVASGTAMASYDGSEGPTTLGSPPDGFQGFGRVLLDSVLNVGGSVDLYVEDWVDMTHDEVHTYSISMDEVSSSAFDGDMKVTMVWMEPAAYASSVAPVFNDLDLLVVAYDGTSESTFYPNKLTAKDPDNTVEMVVIPSVDSYEWFNVTVTGASVTTTNLPYYALVVTGGTSGAYSPTTSATRSWFVRWQMDIDGIPVAQAATESFEAGLAAAISSETGDYTDQASSVVVKIARTEGDDGDGDGSNGSTITTEIVVASEADGYAVLTYIISVGEGSSGGSSGSAGAGDGQGLTAALNEALQGRTTDGCICVAVEASAEGGGYDCSACEEGGAFSAALSVTTSQQSGGNGYDLLSTDRSSGQPPVSVFGSADSEGVDDDDMFWSDFAGGKAIRGIIRSDSYLDMAGVVVAIVSLTALGLFLLRRRCPGSAGDAAGKRLSLTASSGGGGGGASVGAMQVLPSDLKGGEARQSTGDRRQEQEPRRSKSSPHGDRDQRKGSPDAYTPQATPAP
ncbi:unnamed protein product, partial [Hapterophycus canaliculatus]